ncbi:MAG: helix-turn-helix domain-containing protein [Euryarchaeota archaeon]|nr:helix-turn-helix domain-containing protein [Euryarchaeota archaeon]
MSEIFDILEKSQSMEILVALINKDKLFLSELLEELKTKDTNTVSRRIDMLRDAGLIKEEGEEKFGGRRYIWLTNKGKKVAILISEIEKLRG